MGYEIDGICEGVRKVEKTAGKELDDVNWKLSDSAEVIDEERRRKGEAKKHIREEMFG